jgi:hypothetical protein
MRCAKTFPRTPCDPRRVRAPQGARPGARLTDRGTRPRTPCDARRRFRGPQPTRYAPSCAPWGAGTSRAPHAIRDDVSADPMRCATTFPRTPCDSRRGRAPQGARLGARLTDRGTRPRTPCDPRRRFRGPHAIRDDVSADPMRSATGARAPRGAARRTTDRPRYAPADPMRSATTFPRTPTNAVRA